MDDFIYCPVRVFTFAKFLLACGYRDIRPVSATHWVGIQPKMYTHAIVKCRIGDHTGIDDCWCYRSLRDAQAALALWDGMGEPIGWMRHPATGRRVSMTPWERDETGREVGDVGVLYVRH
jgi:hypothetical protein